MRNATYFIDIDQLVMRDEIRMRERRFKLQVCEKCKNGNYILNLFENQWVCNDCYKRLVAKRDAEYYQDLAIKTRELK